MTAVEIAAALGGRRVGRWWSCRCPAHDDRSPSLSLRDGDRGIIVRCWAGCGARDVLAALRRLGLLDNGAAAPASPTDPAETERRRGAEERNRRQRITEALDFWQHETDPTRPHSTVERYWLSRGLALPIPSTIRASRSWWHPDGGSRPAMIALVEHVADGPVAIHRTWLAIDGPAKAIFREPRRALGPVKGGAVRLAHAGEVLMIGEGIETTAAAITATGWPGWAALSAGGIEAIILPPLPVATTVVILADNDVNGRGEHAARTAAARWLAEGRRVRIALPPVPGTDMADVLAGRAYAEVRDVVG